MKPMNQEDTEDEVFIMNFRSQTLGIISLTPSNRLVLNPMILSL
jgi:hypothetical protein